MISHYQRAEFRKASDCETQVVSETSAPIGTDVERCIEKATFGIAEAFVSRGSTGEKEVACIKWHLFKAVQCDPSVLKRVIRDFLGGTMFSEDVENDENRCLLRLLGLGLVNLCTTPEQIPRLQNLSVGYFGGDRCPIVEN